MEPDAFNQLSLPEMKKEISRMRKLANQRLSRLEQAGVSGVSQSYQNLEHFKGASPRFRGDINTKQAARSAYLEVSRFLDNKTSTVRGTRKVWQQTENAFGRELTEQEVSNIWRVYNRWKDSNMGLFYMLGSERVQDLIGEVYRGESSVEEVLEAVNAQMEEAYIASQANLGPAYDPDIVWRIGDMSDEEFEELFGPYQ